MTAFRQDLKHDLDALQVDVRSADEALATELKKQRELMPVTAKRNDALIAAIDQKIESISEQIEDIRRKIEELERYVEEDREKL